ncbi:hypothetical protein FS842_010855 [Serendipita sp. 407]|nr:hypothetical protein FS842_010855 [Serendipita sp. 407]
MLLYSAVSVLLSLGLAAKALPVTKMGSVDLAKKNECDICTVDHDGKEFTIRGHLVSGGTQKKPGL